MVLSAAQMAVMSRLLDEALPLERHRPRRRPAASRSPRYDRAFRQVPGPAAPAHPATSREILARLGDRRARSEKSPWHYPGRSLGAAPLDVGVEGSLRTNHCHGEVPAGKV